MDLPPIAPVFPHTERLVWDTEILRSLDGSPQWISRRKIPRQQLDYSYPLRDDAEVAVMESLIYGQAKGQWPIPLWGQQVLHAGPLAAGATTIAVDTRYSEFLATNDQITGRAVVWQRGRSEIVTVSAVADAALTVSALTQSYNGTKLILPCRTGYLLTAAAGVRWGSGAGMIDLSFEAVDNWVVEGHTSAYDVDFTEVLTTPSYYLGDSGSLSFDPDIVRITQRGGRLAIRDITDYPLITQQHGFVLQDAAACYAHRQWLGAVLGRQKSFFVPTFRPDLVLAANVAADATEIYVDHRALTDGYDGSYLRQYVGFRPPGADPVVCKVTDIEEISSTVEKLTLADAPGQAFGIGAELCWVDRCHLASDTVTLTWHKRQVATCDTVLLRSWQHPVAFGDGLFGMGVMAG